jgi:hypothetical protein
MYGCQLTFGNFDSSFKPADIWGFHKPGELPYLDINNQVANPSSPGPNFQSPTTTWQTQTAGPCAILTSNAHQAPGDPKKPGTPWWDKYHAAFWWP